MKYTAISRNFRGFNYQTDYASVDDWKKEMMREAKGADETEWSILIHVHNAEPIIRYNRGVLFAELSKNE